MKAAQAAAEYLSHLYDLFDCWALALAAYNCGENRVRATLDRTGFKTFWELRDNGFLPSETREYVPKIMAVVKISQNPAQYGFHYEPWRYTPKYETVMVPGGVRLCRLGEKIGVDEQTLKTHNPELQSNVIPSHVPAYELIVPVGKKDAVIAAVGGPVFLGERASVGSAVSDSNRSFQVRKISSSRDAFEQFMGAVSEGSRGLRLFTRQVDARPVGSDRIHVSAGDVYSEHEMAALSN